MMAISKARTELIRDTIRRYPNWGKQTIAKHILQNYGHLFNNNLEAIRSSIRYHCGQMGEKNRAKVGDRLIERTEKIILPQSWNVPVEPYIMTPGKWFILNDVHIPFHEERPLQTAIDFAKKEKPDGIYLNGDIWEGQSVSFWPSVRRDFLGEVAAVIDFLDYLKQEFPFSRIVYTQGNHEARISRYFINKASEMATSPAIELETYMSFEARGIEFLEQGTLVKFGYMSAIHGHEVQNICSSVAPARGLFLRTKTCAFCGHVHRTNMYPARDLNGKMIVCYTVGCMSNLHPEFHRYGNDWNHGFAILDLKKDNNFSFRNYRIMNDGKDIEL